MELVPQLIIVIITGLVLQLHLELFYSAVAQSMGLMRVCSLCLLTLGWTIPVLVSGLELPSMVNRHCQLLQLH
nr:MAG TPA: hypothetical protein [Caudoviricetes sp.]